MAKNKRLSPNELAKEKGYFANLKKIQDYAPHRAEYKVEAIEPVEGECDNLRELEAQKVAELKAVRDQIAAADTRLVEKNDGAAVQVASQFGEDSAEYQSLGRTRKSERKTGGRRSGGNTPNG